MNISHLTNMTQWRIQLFDYRSAFGRSTNGHCPLHRQIITCAPNDGVCRGIVSPRAPTQCLSAHTTRNNRRSVLHPSRELVSLFIEFSGSDSDTTRHNIMRAEANGHMQTTAVRNANQFTGMCCSWEFLYAKFHNLIRNDLNCVHVADDDVRHSTYTYRVASLYLRQLP